MKIEICSRKKALVKVEQNPGCNLISIVDFGRENPDFKGVNTRLDLSFNDINTSHIQGPSLWHVAEIIHFAAHIDQRPLIIHCTGGISRSSAAALIVYAAKFGHAGIRDYFRPMLGLIHPNIEMLRLADPLFADVGALISAGEHFRNWDLLVDGKDD